MQLTGTGTPLVTGLTLAVMGVIAVAFAALWIVAMSDVLQRDDSEFPSRRPGSNERMFWGFVVLFLSGIGAAFYYVTVMRPYPRQRR